MTAERRTWSGTVVNGWRCCAAWRSGRPRGSARRRTGTHLRDSDGLADARGRDHLHRLEDLLHGRGGRDLRR
ncbi:hypothetical protein QJS66_00300 [Kocuria rhizophila]|nr:hypothetical protein QJS66_00300 [Kocuria rhizophila]